MSNLPTLAHAELGASKAERWMNCPGSIRLSRGIKESKSDYALEGTAAHEVASRALLKNLDADVWLDTEVKGVLVDEEMCNAVQVYLDHVRQRVDTLQACLCVERTFDLSPLNPPGEMFGTADCVLYNGSMQSDHLEVIDYKHGVGVTVDAHENAQLMYYALGAVLELRTELVVKPKTLRVTIVQPRGFHPDGIVRSYDFNYDRLREFKHELFEAAQATGRDDAPLAVGDWCRFCPALPVCPEQERHMIEVAQSEFSIAGPPPPEQLSIEQLTEVLSKAQIVKDWIASVYTHVQALLEAGDEVPGWKLVPKRSTRKWNGEESDVRSGLVKLGLPVDALYQPPKLRSVAQIEKELKTLLPRGEKKKAAQALEDSGLVVKESSGNTIAPTTDARPAVAGSMAAEDEFTALPQAAD